MARRSATKSPLQSRKVNSLSSRSGIDLEADLIVEEGRLFSSHDPDTRARFRRRRGATFDVGSISVRDTSCKIASTGVPDVHSNKLEGPLSSTVAGVVLLLLL